MIIPDSNYLKPFKSHINMQHKIRQLWHSVADMQNAKISSSMHH